jgi:UDP-N-acetylglucosamine:LPS N-acetylglucosamine transferase
MFTEAGAGVLYKGSFAETIKGLLGDNSKRAAIGRAAESLVKKDAARMITDIILEYTGG